MVIAGLRVSGSVGTHLIGGAQRRALPVAGLQGIRGPYYVVQSHFSAIDAF